MIELTKEDIKKFQVKDISAKAYVDGYLEALKKVMDGEDPHKLFAETMYEMTGLDEWKHTLKGIDNRV